MERLQLLSKLFFVLLSLNGVQCASNPAVKIQQGKLQGTTFTSARSGQEFFGFMGIPYGKSPVGSLRFKAPEPAASWTGTRDASEEGNVCIQMSTLHPVQKGQEDCLFINVYTPQLPDLNKNLSLLPVMVWIHGGGFTFGSGNRALQGPDYLIDDGVVIVTFNYRLGAFGFLSLENKETPGNAGLKDQVLALRWVQQNVAEFGGDPKNVTIFGHSAGAASVHYHMLSPLSEGLFHKAISQSGSVLCPWAYTRTARKVAFRLGALLGKNTTDDAVLLDFLRGVPPEDILQMSSSNLLPQEERNPLGFGFVFVPTKEAVYEGGEEVFLPGEPKDLVMEGKFEQVPYLIGTCSHEGYIVYRISENAGMTLDHVNNDLGELVHPSIHSREDMTIISDIGKQIKNFYFGYNNISTETLQDFVKLATDFYYKFPAYRTVKLQSAVSTSPIYFYQFNFDGAYGYMKEHLGFEGMPGASHGDELGYLFAQDTLTNLSLSIGDPEVVTSYDLVKMWTDFAKTGNPTPDSQLNIQWLPYTIEQHNCLVIDNDLALEVDLDKERMEFCEGLYNTQIRQ